MAQKKTRNHTREQNRYKKQEIITNIYRLLMNLTKRKKESLKKNKEKEEKEKEEEIWNGQDDGK